MIRRELLGERFEVQGDQFLFALLASGRMTGSTVLPIARSRNETRGMAQRVIEGWP